MIRGLARGIAKLALIGAAMAFVSGVVLFLTASFLLTWPLHRLSPRNRKMRAGMDLAAAFTVALAAFGIQVPTADD